MKKIYLIRTIKMLALMLPIVAVVLFAQTYLLLDPSLDVQRLHGFYQEEKDSLDVVVLGASDVFAGFSPAYAYELGGFTSYVYAINSNPASLYLAQLKEIISHQHPQLILIEANGFLYDDEKLTAEAPLRVFSETMPMSWNKLDTILRHPYEDKLSCLLPFVKYHQNLNAPVETLKENYERNLLLQDEVSVLKGIWTRTFSDLEDISYDINDDSIREPITPLAEQYLDELMAYCSAEKIDNVLFVRFPHKLSTEDSWRRFKRANTLEKLVQEKGYMYLNLERNSDEIGIDPYSDFYHSEHMNILGQIRTTEYLADWIISEYGLIPKEQSETVKQQWENSKAHIAAYMEIADEYMQEGHDAELYEAPEIMAMLQERIAE